MDGKGDGNGSSDDTPMPGEAPLNDAEQMQENVDTAQGLLDQLADLGTVDQATIDSIQDTLDAAQEALNDTANNNSGGGDDSGGGSDDGWTPY